MERHTGSTSKSLENRRSNVLAFAVTVGLLAFFMTGELDGGLSGLQGFFIGMFSVILMFFLLGLAEILQRKPDSVQEERVALPSQLLVTQSEGEGGISIKIHLGREFLNKVDPNDR